MIEKITPSENVDRVIFDESQVISVIKGIVGEDKDFPEDTLTREYDEKGLSKFSVRLTVEGAEGPEDVQYDYRRCDHAGNTVIDVVFYVGDMVVGGNSVLKYKNGEWVAE
jgi:hypothetical protein